MREHQWELPMLPPRVFDGERGETDRKSARMSAYVKAQGRCGRVEPALVESAMYI